MVTAKVHVKKLLDVVIPLHSEEHCNAAAYCFHCRDAHQERSRQCPTYRLEQDLLQLATTQFISLGSARCELLPRQKAGTGATSYASLAARTSIESAGPKTTPSATSRCVGAGGPVHLANRFSLLSDDSVESPARSDENNTDLTKLTHVVEVQLPPASRKLLKSMTKRHRGSAEPLDLAQPKQSKVSPGAHNLDSVKPPVTSSVSDHASCDEDGLCMETSDDIVTAVPRRPTLSVHTDPRLPMAGRSDDDSHHSPVGRKAAFQQPGTSQLPVTSRRLIISSQASHGQPIQKAHPSTAPK
ncbi:hypothetical protein E2C01_084876 [Portunus trituberculatus]|uniref:Uncharacterized protein n=1 Tax=Portunus trituberculatus TaxID=210409 RepID=A0A5B7J5Z5_PORTR|nr:hypothetical protein [Portunus trituberculatus]